MPEPERPSMAIPAELTRRAEALIAGGDAWSPPPARDAATIILLRESPEGIEIFLQRRVGSMAFAAGMHVFPGGRVEESDADEAVPWSGDPGWEPFSAPPVPRATSSYRALTVAAARETWEEAGVALASSRAGEAVSGHPETAEDDLLVWVRERGLTISGDRLLPWTHWITPEVESRRFDTRFVITVLPAGQQAVDRGVESETSLWITPGKAIDRLRAGEMPMLPPTADALTQVGSFSSIRSILAEARGRRPRPFLPRPVTGPGGSVQWQIVDAYRGDVIVSP